jgi:predicted transcriptional regulator of viral defense system
MTAPPAGPRWDRIYEVAMAQAGFFTTQQAAELGYSSQLINHYLRTNRVERATRGIYRLVHFPPSDHQDLIVEWLWSERQGVFSHETALSLHGLSDVMPARIHLSLPTAASQRRRKLHEDLMLHYADVPITDRSWITNVPVTTPRRTLLDCALDGTQAEFLRHATQQAVKRGLVGRADLVEVERALNADEGTR